MELKDLLLLFSDAASSLSLLGRPALLERHIRTLFLTSYTDPFQEIDDYSVVSLTRIPLIGQGRPYWQNMSYGELIILVASTNCTENTAKTPGL